jgi:hypothetical protein
MDVIIHAVSPESIFGGGAGASAYASVGIIAGASATASDHNSAVAPRDFVNNLSDMLMTPDAI